MLDVWQEILDTVRKNKLRTGLTALSVAWGIFMLVLLLAAGTGLQNSVEYDFRDDAVNSVWVRSGRTLLPFAGHRPNREIHLTNEDYEVIRDHIPGVEHVTSRYFLSGEFVVSHGDRRASFDVRSCHPDHRYLEKTIVVAGRFLNDIDIARRRKVAVIGVDVVKALFADGEEPIGAWIDVRGIRYRVVGVFEDEGGEGELRRIYVPISTAQLAYGAGNRIHQVMLTVSEAWAARADQVESNVRRVLASRHQFSPDDRGAVRMHNRLEDWERINAVFTWIRIFVWIVGIGTVVAGLVGVSNIMLIAVKERTREIGVRMAVGATPRSIVALIVQEALFITGVSGYLGLVAGVGAVELASRLLPADVEYFRNPEVNFAAVVGATVLLVVTGTLAGLFPARRAALVNPVVALRDE